MKSLVYAIEDDASIRELYTYALANDFDFMCFENGETFFDKLVQNKPDIVLLDVMLPGDNGFVILSKLKTDKETANIPVIMVSAKDDEISKVKGLNIGADDYVAKPFGVLELLARIKANLRKNEKASKTEKIIYKDVVIDYEKHQITVNSQHIQATRKEFNLLALLCGNAEKVQMRESIFQKIWGEDFYGETRTLDIHIKELRKKLASAESNVTIRTVRGIGYILS